jgi:hypothetical protein
MNLIPRLLTDLLAEDGSVPLHDRFIHVPLVRLQPGSEVILEDFTDPLVRRAGLVVGADFGTPRGCMVQVAVRRW